MGGLLKINQASMVNMLFIFSAKIFWLHTVSVKYKPEILFRPSRPRTFFRPTLAHRQRLV